jgi:flagellar biosynthesis GTPase FlhF
MSNGWIKLHRKVLNNRFWNSEPFSRGQAWVDLLLLANHEPGIIYVRDHKIMIDRGVVGWSENRLAERWSWSRTKVRKFLKDLETEQQIRQEKNKSYSTIRIENYDIYQDEKQEKEQQQDKSKTRARQEQDTNKKNKECKEEERIEYNTWIDYWNKANNAEVRLTEKKRTQITARLKNFTEQEIQTAISNRASDEWINGDGQKFKADWESFWRNDEKVERYLHKQENKFRAPNQKFV